MSKTTKRKGEIMLIRKEPEIEKAGKENEQKDMPAELLSSIDKSLKTACLYAGAKLFASGPGCQIPKPAS